MTSTAERHSPHHRWLPLSLCLWLSLSVYYSLLTNTARLLAEPRATPENRVDTPPAALSEAPGTVRVAASTAVLQEEDQVLAARRSAAVRLAPRRAVTRTTPARRPLPGMKPGDERAMPSDVMLRLASSAGGLQYYSRTVVLSCRGSSFVIRIDEAGQCY